MLTQKQWRMIQAALRYFDEELSPHGPDAFRAYLVNETVTAQELVELRELWDSCELQIVPPHSSSRGDQSLSGDPDG